MEVDRICTQCRSLHANEVELNHPMCDDCVRELLDQLDFDDVD